jgi:hypothetical protein
MLTQQRINGVEQRIAAIDLDLRNEGPGDDADRLLEERFWLVQQLAALQGGLIANG